MKDILNKYYGIDIDYYKELDNGLLFQIDGINYLLCKTNYDETYINELYKVCLDLKKDKTLLHDFVFNKNGLLLTEGYILFKINVLLDDITINDIYKFNQIDCNKYKEQYITMEKFWEEKIDYLEIQISELSDKQLINYSFDYFIGIAEIIIMFLKKNNTNIDLCLSHKSLNSLKTIDFYNPLNITFDLKLKDIASYIRLSNNISLLEDILDKQDESFNKAYLFARLVFPFKYFDIIGDMVVDQKEEKDLVIILNQIDMYEDYLYKIEQMFGIYLFSWLKKSN